MPTIFAYHVIVSAYGFWLPNDPRGNWSDFVESWELLRYGKATKVTTPESLAWVDHDREQRLAAKTALRRPPVMFDGRQAQSIDRGFAQAVNDARLTVYACAILPDHVHLVLQRAGEPVDGVIGRMKSCAARQLSLEEIHPFQKQSPANERRPSPWAEGCWKVFIDNGEHLAAATRYVENNPLKEGKRRQRWSFVTALRGPCRSTRLAGEPAKRGWGGQSHG